MPVVWSDDHRLHDPGGEVWLGVRIPGTELPARAERSARRSTADGAWFVDARAAAGRRRREPSTTRS